MGHHIKVRPHHDLLNLAFYHKGVIEDKCAKSTREAIALDCMSCLIALAFSVEALVNFVGDEKVDGWDEWANFDKKLSMLSRDLNTKFDKALEPFLTVTQLKTIRNQMAHAKPIEVEKEISSREAIECDMRTPWDDWLTPQFTIHAFSQVKAFENRLLAAAGIDLWDTLTSGSAVY